MAGVTIKDLARLAKVHPSTVSLALADDPRLPEGTRRRLQALAAEHRYTPNPAARWLRQGRTGTVGLVLWEETRRARLGRVQAQLLAAVGAAVRREYQVLVIPATRERLARDPIDVIVRRSPVDGALCMGPTADRPGLARLVRSGFPVVHHGWRQLPGVELACVSADYHGGGRQGVEHLLQQGHRRIAVLTDPQVPAEVVQARVGGYADALGAAGVAHDPALTLAYDGHAGRLLARLRRLGATALFTTTAPPALELLPACAAAGVRVPDDLAVVAFDDSEGCAQATPPLTAVRQPADEIAVGAMNLLLRLVDGADLPPPERQRFLPMELIVRRSSLRQGAAPSATGAPPPA